MGSASAIFAPRDFPKQAGPWPRRLENGRDRRALGMAATWHCAARRCRRRWLAVVGVGGAPLGHPSARPVVRPVHRVDAVALSLFFVAVFLDDGRPRRAPLQFRAMAEVTAAVIAGPLLASLLHEQWTAAGDWVGHAHAHARARARVSTRTLPRTRSLGRARAHRTVRSRTPVGTRMPCCWASSTQLLRRRSATPTCLCARHAFATVRAARARARHPRARRGVC